MEFLSVIDMADGFPLVVPLHPKEWTAVVPAAGRGSRLGFDMPKILYPVGGKTILEWLTVALDTVVSRFVFVLSPAGRDQVEPHLAHLLPGRFSVVLQSEPRGMADAVWAARDAVPTRRTLVVWGDQVGVKTRTVRRCMEVHTARNNAHATVPTLLRQNPYIHFERDGSGRLVRILQAREGDAMPPVGEADCGVFCFETSSLFDVLGYARDLPIALGARTREWNLLPVLPMLDHTKGSLTCVRIHDAAEAIGINSPSDARDWNDCHTDR